MTRPEITGKKSALSAELPATLHDDQILNLKQVAAFRGCSVATVRRQVAAGEFPVIRVSERRVGVRVGDLKANLGGRRA